jgi:ATP-dependent Lon protease
VIFGASADKDIEGMFVELAPRVSRVIVTQAAHPRAAEPPEVVALAHQHGLRTEVVSPVRAALETAMGRVRPNEVIVSAGSLFVSAEILSAWDRCRAVKADAGGGDAIGSPQSSFRLPSELALMGRRADELYQIEDSPLDADGCLECSVLPLRDVVLYPNMVTPLFVSQESTLQAIEAATRAGRTMVAVTQLDPEAETPGPGDFYTVGTEVAVGRQMHIPDGSTSVLTQGRRRIQIVELIPEGDGWRARGRPVDESADRGKETTALMRAVRTLFEKCVQLNRSLPEEAYVYAVNIEEPGWLADLVASALSLSVAERQDILETFDPIMRLQRISVMLGRELDVLELEDHIHSQVQNEVDRSQREMYLREQLKAIQTELGEADAWALELNELRERVSHLGLPEEVEVRALKEIARLSQMPPLSPEVSILRTTSTGCSSCRGPKRRLTTWMCRTQPRSCTGITTA